MKILFYGYGNPGRQDDALGILFCDHLEKWVRENKIKEICFDSNYQLNIEDADTIAGYDLVFFVDASMESVKEFTISEIEQSNAQVEFTMHAISPGVVLNLCSQIYSNRVPMCVLIHIKGFEWDLDFEKGLSKKAKNNLKLVLGFIKNEMSLVKQYSKEIIIKRWEKIINEFNEKNTVIE